jgi:hypothetical protein
MDNYKKKIAELIAEGKLQPSVGLNDLLILHDDWCACFRGFECDCNPTLELRTDVTPEEIAKLHTESAKKFQDVVNKKKL